MKNKKYNCYFELALDIIAGKWKLLIIYHIAENNLLRHRNLKDLIPNIHERMLTRQLRELESSHIIKRMVFNQVPPRVEYSLTDLGTKLIPLLVNLNNFGYEYNQHFDQDLVVYRQENEELFS